MACDNIGHGALEELVDGGLVFRDVVDVLVGVLEPIE